MSYGVASVQTETVGPTGGRTDAPACFLSASGVPMSRLVSLSLVLLAMLVAVPVASAATRYVATTGDDSANDCLSQAAPCLTIQRGVNQSVAGDVVDVAAGTYAAGATVTT